MRFRILTAAIISILLATTPCISTAQTKKSTSVISEENIRAELGFLASDALQGRASGTNYERIAAEYIGSQFRQFGLEPGGDRDGSGQKGFVQRVPLNGVRFKTAPTLTISSGSDLKIFTFGKDFLVSFLRSSNISGDLQLIDADGTPAKSAVALIKIPEEIDSQKRQDIIRKARAAQAAAVLLIETDANKRTRESGDIRLPNLAKRIRGQSGNETSFAAIALSKESFDSIATLTTPAKVVFAGETEQVEDSATWNAIGVLRGSDPKATQEVIVLSAHLDHLGVAENPSGPDAIFNGADDDASGCVAVLEMARVLAAGKRPRRTIYFICFGSEERGGYGAQYFVANSPVPLAKIVADITFEMLGRPDAKVAPNTLWLTGFERSNLGPELAKQGALLVPDPHPEQNFFQRSDNYTLALRGIVAHTVSSFGLHTDYHRVSDDISKIDFPFMTRSIQSMVKPIRWLANSAFKPTWLPGKAPTR
jgi:Zn-dependent M28 family amino/carboxypeptidase